MMDPFKIYYDEVLIELQRIQTKMFPGKIFPRLSDELMTSMVKDKWEEMSN